MDKKNILITGVAGLLGSNMADWILNNHQEYNVIGVDDLSGGYIDNVNDKVIFENYNLSDKNLSSLFEKYNFDYVFHFAAYAAEGLSPFIRTFNYQNNLLCTANIVNNCIEYNVKRLIFTSSMAVYGVGNPPFDEKDLLKPIDPYGIAKFACEMDIQIAGEQHNLDWCIIRPHNVYGIKQNIWDKYRNVLGIWMYQTLNNQPMTIFGDGNQTRAFSYIDDILEPLWISAVSEKTSKQIINLGGTKEYTINEVNDVLKKVTGNDNTIHLESRHEVKNAHPTWEKSVELLNYKDIHTLEEGLTKMWEWAKSQPSRPQYKWSEYEINKGIYSFWK